MIRLHYIIPIICSLILAACTDELEHPYVANGNQTVAIAVSLNEMGETTLQSRAAVSDDDDKCLSVVEDLHFKITLKEGDPIFFSLSTGQASVDQSLDAQIIHAVPAGEGAGDKAYIHFNSLKTSDIDKVEVIGNYSGKQNLSSTSGWEAALKELIYFPIDLDYSKDDPDKMEDNSSCQLYGSTETPSAKGEHGMNCDLFKVELKRPYAMIKVHVKEKNLNPRIEIIPQTVQLFNVPVSCTLGEDNYIKELTSDRRREGMLTGFKDGVKSNNTVAFDTESRIYMFENLGNKKAQHCADESSAYRKDGIILEWKKNPNKAVADSKYDKFNTEAYAAFETNTDNPNNLGNYCTFIKVSARYVIKDNSGNEILAGKINYRLFLGENIGYNFDVKRNNIYDVTLMLTADGGVQEAGGTIDNPQVDGGWKWRVDYNGGVYLWPNEIDLNSGTEMTTINVVEIEDYLKKNYPNKKFVWGIFDTTNPDGPQPNIQCGYDNAFLPKTYRFKDGMRPVFWTGSKWDEIGDGTDILNGADALPVGQEMTIDGERHVFHPYTYIFSPFRQWELDENEVEHPYREYTIIFAVTDENDNKLRFSYLNDVEKDEADSLKSSWTYPLVANLIKDGNYTILAKAVVRQWNPIKVYDNPSDVGNHKKVAFYLDRKDRDLMPFGENDSVSYKYNHDENGFKASVGLYQADPSFAQKQMGKNFMNPEGAPEYISAYAYGLYLGAYKFGNIFNGEYQGKLGFFDKKQFDLSITDFKGRIWPVGSGFWDKNEEYPPVVYTSGSMMFRGWSLPSDHEWGYLIKGYYTKGLEGEVSALLAGSYWSANYDDKNTAHVMSSGEIKKDGLRSRRLPVRFRNSFNAWRVDEEAGLEKRNDLLQPNTFAEKRDLYRLPSLP